MASIMERAKAEADYQFAHKHAGRISNSYGWMATVCSCGDIFLRPSVADADNAHMVHQHLASQGEVQITSWSV